MRGVFPPDPGAGTWEPMDEATAEKLQRLFDAERAVRETHEDLCRKGASLLPALGAAIEAARKESEAERTLRLVRIAELLGEIGGAEAVDRLVDLLGEDASEVRVVAGESLEEMAYARFKEVALGVERALARLPPEHPALCELPYLLAEVPEPGAAKLVRRFLSLSHPEPVAAAIEALVELGEPDGAGALRALLKDKRTVNLEGDEGEAGTVTIGELASEAAALLERVGREAKR